MVLTAIRSTQYADSAFTAINGSTAISDFTAINGTASNMLSPCHTSDVSPNQQDVEMADTIDPITSTTRANTSDAIVREYLGLDAKYSTKKAALMALVQHPLAAPPRSRLGLARLKRDKDRRVSDRRANRRPELPPDSSETTSSPVIKPRPHLTGRSSAERQRDFKASSCDVGVPPSCGPESVAAPDESTCLNSPDVCSDDDMDSSLDDEDLMQLAEALDASAIPAQESSACLFNEQQLPTPFASDAPHDNAAVDKALDNQQQDVDNTDAQDDWLDIDEDRYAELLDLTDRAEQSQAHRSAAIQRNGDVVDLVTPPDAAARRIARSPFPEPIKDRSPIIGLSADMLLRTCFRIGEALNTGCQAVRVGRGVTLQLFARVTSSWRTPPDSVQHFRFEDLFHDRPPYIDAVYEKSAELRDHESEIFLKSREGGRLCRCVGQMARVDHKWRLEVMRISEVDWNDVEYTAGIYCA